MKIARNTFYLLTSAALALAACGGGGGGETMEPAETTAETEERRVDVCGVLTASDIEEALGAAVGEPQPGDEGLGQCSWSSSESGDTVVDVTLEEALLGSFDEFVTEFGIEFGGENPPRDEYHPVEGVPGDWAMYVAEEQMVRAFRGDDELQVRAPGASEEQVVELASRAMGQLP